MMQPHVIKRVVVSDILARAEISQTEKRMATKFPNRIDDLLIPSNITFHGWCQCP